MGKKTLAKQKRLSKARHWIPTYNGTKILKGYKKKFSVDTPTALRELQELGMEFDPDYIVAVESGEKHRLLQLQQRKQEKINNDATVIKKVGKNHIKVNGKLLQTNKKWSQLKQKQRDWIYENVRLEHQKFVDQNDRLPRKHSKKELIAIVEAKVDERGIWLPSYELENGIGKYIDRLNRKADC